MKKFFIIFTILITNIVFANNEHFIRITPNFSALTSPTGLSKIENIFNIGVDFKYSNNKLKTNFNNDKYIIMYFGSGIKESFDLNNYRFYTKISLLAELDYKFINEFSAYANTNLQAGFVIFDEYVLSDFDNKTFKIGLNLSHSIEAGIKFKNFRFGGIYSNEFKPYFNQTSLIVDVFPTYGIIIGYDFDI